MEQENHDNPDLNAPISFQELDTFIRKLIIIKPQPLTKYRVKFLNKMM